MYDRICYRLPGRGGGNDGGGKNPVMDSSGGGNGKGSTTGAGHGGNGRGERSGN